MKILILGVEGHDGYIKLGKGSRHTATKAFQCALPKGGVCLAKGCAVGWVGKIGGLHQTFYTHHHHYLAFFKVHFVGGVCAPLAPFGRGGGRRKLSLPLRRSKYKKQKNEGRFSEMKASTQYKASPKPRMEVPFLFLPSQNPFRTVHKLPCAFCLMTSCAVVETSGLVGVEYFSESVVCLRVLITRFSIELFLLDLLFFIATLILAYNAVRSFPRLFHRSLVRPGCKPPGWVLHRSPRNFSS